MRAAAEWFRARRGNAAVILVLSLLAILAVAALGTDITWLVECGAELRTAADFSALSAVGILRSDRDQARMIAHDIAEANEAAEAPVLLDLNVDNNPDGDIVIGRWSCPGDELGHDGVYDCGDGSFQPMDFGANAIKVVARRTTDSLSGPIFPILGQAIGHDVHQMERFAIAMVTGSTGNGIVALCPDCECAFKFYGGGQDDVSLSVGDASIYVNSSDSCAACGEGHAAVEGGSLEIVGDACYGGQADFYGDLNPGVDPIPDPLEDLVAPAPSSDAPGTSWAVDPSIDMSCHADELTLNPGYYSQGIQHSSSSSRTLTSGIYVLGPPLHMLSASIDFDGAEEDVSPGVSEFTYDTMAFTGGTVSDLLPESGAFAYEMLGAGGTMTITPAADTVTFHFAHDDSLGIPQATATVIDSCDNVVATVTSSDPGNFKSVGPLDFPIKRIEFDGGVIDAVSITRDEGGLSVTGGGSVDVQDAMLYIASGSVYIAGGTGFSISPPASGTWEHISFFQARDNTADASIQGTNDSIVGGTFYFPSAKLYVSGTSESFTNGLIAWQIEIHGNGYMQIDYDGFMGNNNLQTFLVK